MGSAEAACLAIFSRFEVLFLEGMCDSDTSGQASRVAFVHPQILRPELCDHVES